MDRMFATALSGSGSTTATGGAAAGMATWAPAIEVKERNNQLEISADLPGMNKDDIKVEVTNDAVILQGERNGKAKRIRMESAAPSVATASSTEPSRFRKDKSRAGQSAVQGRRPACFDSHAGTKKRPSTDSDRRRQIARGPIPNRPSHLPTRSVTKILKEN